MIRETTTPNNVIYLDGPDGNAFALMASAKKLARDVGYTANAEEAILKIMMSGDYTNLVKTFDEYFGDCIILETENKELLNA
jgi:hypothetical protein